MTIDPSERTYGVTPIEVLRTLTGLEFLQKIKNGELPGVPISRTLGYAMSHVAPGTVTFESVPKLEHYNPIGTVHGGYAATLLDSCMACAIQTLLPAGKGYTTLEIKINYVRALTDKVPKVLAIGNVIHSGRRAATSEGRLVDETGVLYAHGTTTCMIFDI
jgi:uncharacterized protein (TIGR00369 family)